MIAVRYRLGVDFGTSNTVAVIHEADGRTRPVLFDGFPLLPSCVCVALDGAGLLVGREAMHAARVHPERFEPHPKRRIDDGTVLLGDAETGAEVSVVRLIAAVLTRVRAETVRAMGGEPGTVVLTYPAAWGPRRRSVLLDAARDAGLGTPALVPEPVAAAAFFVAATGAAVPVGSRVVVYDFGAGTFDASVVTRTATGWEVIASEGLDDAGGLDVDAAVVDYLGTVHSGTHPEQLRRLISPRTVDDRRAHRHLWEEVRTAKEILSRSASTYIHVPLLEQDAPLGREQLERLARPVVERTVALTRTVLTSADPGRPLAGLFLVGGSSRMPLVATLLHRATGVAPTVLEQPELVVAEGSARPLATTGATQAADAAGVRTAAPTPLWPATTPAPADPDASPPARAPVPTAIPTARPAARPAASGVVYGTPAATSIGSQQAFSLPPVSNRPAVTPPPGPSWPDETPLWPVSPAAAPQPPQPATFGAAPAPTDTPTDAPASPPTEASTGAPPGSARPGAVRRLLITGAVLIGALLLFGLLGRKAADGEWGLPDAFADWSWWIGEARAYLFPGFVVWLAYLFAAPAGRTALRVAAHGVLIVPAALVAAEVAVVTGWAAGPVAVFVLLLAGLTAAVALLAARRSLDGTEVRPVFGRADAGGLALGVLVAVLAAAPEYQGLIEDLRDGDAGLAAAMRGVVMPAPSWYVAGLSVTLPIAGLGAVAGRLAALRAPAVTRWLPRIAAAVLLAGSAAAVSQIATALFG